MTGLILKNLVIKGVQRIESINTPYEKRVESEFESWQCCRIIRRDFNLLTAKMYMLSRKQQNLHSIKKLLRIISLEALAIKVEFSNFEAPPVQAISVQLRLVSDEAETLLEAFKVVDAALSKAISTREKNAPLNEFKSFFSAYSDLKKFTGLSRRADEDEV